MTTPPTPDNGTKCTTCFGYGLWAMGAPAPMGPLDASDGLPTLPCPECGANRNPAPPLKTSVPPAEEITVETFPEHQRLLGLVIRKPQDYPPFGEQSRDVTLPTGEKGWYFDCSAGCIYARWLDDEEHPLATDWCVCTNPESHRVGLLTFEHQGCPKGKYDWEKS